MNEQEMKLMVDGGAFMPLRAYPTDAGLDLRAKENAWVYSGSFHDFDTGIHFEIPEGHYGAILPKSGLMAKGLLSFGVVDSDYRGSVHVILFNFGKEAYKVEKGDKISQLIINECVIPKIKYVDGLTETERGDKGFGSSGK